MKKILIALIICLSFNVKAQNQQTINLTTGTAAVGFSDPIWNVKVPSGATQNAIASNGNFYVAANTSPYDVFPGYTTNSCGKWISPYTITTAGPAFGAIPKGASNLAYKGTYVYRMHFNTNSQSITSATINLNLAGADNNLQSIAVNGNVIQSLPGNITFNPLSTGITLTVPPAFLTCGGINTISVTVYNEDTFTGLILCGNLTINYSPLSPSFTSNTILCDGDPLIFIGSETSGGTANHVWTIVETDAGGTTVAGATTWWSPWFPGSPGTYTFPSLVNGGPAVQCGKYYRVALAVANACETWKATTKVIYIACKNSLSPSFTGKTNFCAGDPLAFIGSENSGGTANHVWTIVETDAGGTMVAGATTWWSTWFTGSPGAYTFPSLVNGGPNIQCGKYYKVTLAVANACESWKATTKLIYMVCNPTLMASTVTICPNSTISAGGRRIGPTNSYPAGSTFSWAPKAGLYTFSSQNPIAMPASTTTYTLTVAIPDGCMQTSQVTVYVLPPCLAHAVTYCDKVLPPAVAGAAIGDGLPGVIYNWHIISGTLSCTSCPKPIATAGKYYCDYSLSYTDASGNFQSCSTNCDGQLWTVSINCDPIGDPIGARIKVENTALIPDRQYTAEIYPNPFNSNFTAIYAGEGEVKVEVMDVLGKILAGKQGVAKQEINLEINDAPSGIYLVKITAEGNTIMKKIIKQ